MIKKEAKLFSYHFDCGNSTDGPIGFCARIRAKTKEEALEILKQALPNEMRIRPICQDEAIEYIEAYISPNNITVKDIDDHEEVEE